MPTLTFVACDETPEQYRHKVGMTTPDLFPIEGPWPAPGFEGTLLGVPGRMLDDFRWEIRPVDMRSRAEKLLDEADALLAKPRLDGETKAEVRRRLAEAQRLILLAQSQLTRVLVNRG